MRGLLLGDALTEVLGANGAKCVLFDINAAVLAATVAKLDGTEVAAFISDVADVANHEAPISTCNSRVRRLDIACADAGIVDPEPARLDRYQSENWHKTVAMNLDGVFFVNRAAPREMSKISGGKVINTASIWGGPGLPL